MGLPVPRNDAMEIVMQMVVVGTQSVRIRKTTEGRPQTQIVCKDKECLFCRSIQHARVTIVPNGNRGRDIQVPFVTGLLNCF